jgi:hypothetical protein
MNKLEKKGLFDIIFCSSRFLPYTSPWHLIQGQCLLRQGIARTAVLSDKAVNWVRQSTTCIKPSQTCYQCCGSGSGVGSGSGQPLSGMNLKQNFSDKIHNFSTRLCIRFPIRYHTDRINYFFQNNRLYISLFSKKTLYIVVISRIQREFATQLSRGGNQRCRIQNRIRIRSQIRSWSRNFLKSWIRIRSRIRNKSFRIYNSACYCWQSPWQIWHSVLKGTQAWEFFGLWFWNLYFFVVSYA